MHGGQGPSGSQDLGLPGAAGRQGRAENEVRASWLDLAQGRRGEEGKAPVRSLGKESPWLVCGWLAWWSWLGALRGLPQGLGGRLFR